VKTYTDIDPTVLKSLKNPVSQAYEIRIKIPECTFLGVQEQPDFADVYLTMYPDQRIIELKSLKHYIHQLRDVVVSYERLINLFYDHLMAAYQPQRLRVVMICNPRGGISSRLTIDSDWKARGGEEVFKDWGYGGDDTWSVVM
jgi:7-cyano-7-deazaguanine reductase